MILFPGAQRIRNTYGNMIVKQQIFWGIVVLMAMACAAGCTDQEQGPVPELRSPALPGQTIVAIGNVTGGGQTAGVLTTGTIDTITVRAGLVPGAKPVNMENISIVYADAVRTESEQPVNGFRGTPGEGSWGIIAGGNEIIPANNRLDDQEDFVIQINPKVPIMPGELVTIVIKPLTGAPLMLRLVAPPVILAGENILTPV